MALTDSQIQDYYKTQTNAAKPLSPAEYEASLKPAPVVAAAPVATPTPTPTPAPTPTPSPAPAPTPTNNSSSTYQPTDPSQAATNNDPAVLAAQANEKAVADFNQHQSDIQNGVIPLSAGQQAQIQNLQNQFQSFIDQQGVINKVGTNTANVRGFQTGAAEYDPSFQVKTIANISSAGVSKIANLQTQEAASVAALTQSFKDANIAESKIAFDRLQAAQKDTAEAIAKHVEDVQKAIKAAQDAKIAADKVIYDTVTKPIQDISAEILKNTGDQKLAAAAGKATTVSEALKLAGSSLQTSSNPDVQSWIFAKQQAEAVGGSIPSYETFKDALDKKKLDSELAKIRAEEGIKFSYSVALEKAKANIANSPNPDYNGNFAATIKLASKAGGTNAQMAAIKRDMQDYIAEGDYGSAYTQVIQSTSGLLKGTAATTFQEQQNSLGVLNELDTVMHEYAVAGGNTNIFKGSADQIQTKIGALMTDPKYASMAVQMNAAFQNYRLQMTGAAFSGPESAEYAAILPSPGNTMNLNLAKLEGAKAYLNSSVETSIKNTVGKGGVYIKQYAEAGGETQLQTVKLTEKMTVFRAASPENEQMVQEIHAQYPDMSLDQIAESLHL